MFDNSGVQDANGDHSIIKILTTQTRIFNKNLLKQLTSEYKT